MSEEKTLCDGMLWICGSGDISAACLDVGCSVFVFIFRFCLLYNDSFCFLFVVPKLNALTNRSCFVWPRVFTVIQHLSKHWKEFARSLSKLSLDLRSTVWFVSVAFENAYIPPVPWCVLACTRWSIFLPDPRFHRLKCFKRNKCFGFSYLY